MATDLERLSYCHFKNAISNPEMSKQTKNHLNCFFLRKSNPNSVYGPFPAFPTLYLVLDDPIQIK